MADGMVENGTGERVVAGMDEERARFLAGFDSERHALSSVPAECWLYVNQFDEPRVEIRVENGLDIMHWFAARMDEAEKTVREGRAVSSVEDLKLYDALHHHLADTRYLMFDTGEYRLELPVVKAYRESLVAILKGVDAFLRVTTD